ncbi:putative disease resistance RPP13-like protein 1 [Ricinus communis]|uniref:NB-ARC domain-containing protein n=1 Tax=Ricinus communis TaxID=3988 RepID=B9SC70_RICCO|nr:putative disease resistance RPP13-like protein 1 [Ricinus communis]EEF38784.1 conserved hypothetical protein [Ricinus communis]
MATTFLLDEAAPFFRKDEKEDIIASLLSVDDATLDTDPPKVICIFGMGGLGKTTLAKSVYNHREVQECFDVKAWISVREEFDVFRILKQILEVTAGTSEHNSTRDHQNILLELKEKLEEKKYLIVLDDVWNDNKADWDSLLGHLKTARTSQGSRIIITTRNETVAFAAGAVRSLLLRFLRNEECWSLFTHLAMMIPLNIIGT